MIRILCWKAPLNPLPTLPVTDSLSEISAALRDRQSAVLVAPPGAGKTTIVPLHLLQQMGAMEGRIILLEPRRLAARAAARRMAALLGEEPGQTVGYAMRLDSRQSKSTRILVVTEGVFARMLLDDPELRGIHTVIFDEFHERSLEGDFALALALDVQGALRADLNLLVMSATLDGARVAKLLGDAPIIDSKGRSFPVELRHVDRAADTPLEQTVARTVRQVLAEETGSILVFLPGQREIERTAEQLRDRIAANVDITPLYGGLDGRAQDAAIRPAPEGRRKIVLATSIAETSITIDGVRVIIDSGLARLPRYEPATGLTRLETVRVSNASADQRAGRAGRTEPGIAIRLWRAEQTAALPLFTPPEILQAELSGLVLDCAAWGVADPSDLAFLDVPPAPALREAETLLQDLDAIDADGRLTKAGKAMRKLALPARLAHMVTSAAGPEEASHAAHLAVLLTERGLGGNGTDIDRRLQNFRNDRGPRAKAAKKLAGRLTRKTVTPSLGEGVADSGELLLFAYPDRVARARGQPGHFVLANGRGAVLDPADPLASSTYLVVADLQGRAANARILSAATVNEEAIRTVLASRLQQRADLSFDRKSGRVRARGITSLGSITLLQEPQPVPPGEAATAILLSALREFGMELLPWPKQALTLRERLIWLNSVLGSPWPDMSDVALLDELENWLSPFLTGEPSFDQLAQRGLHDALLSRVPPELQAQIDKLAPVSFSAPAGSSIPIRYTEGSAVLSSRVQSLYGLDVHPMLAGGKVPLVIELLSPARRPVQTTTDLPGFWRGSWTDVRIEMKGRYPKHDWPADPAIARAKPKRL